MTHCMPGASIASLEGDDMKSKILQMLMLIATLPAPAMAVDATRLEKVVDLPLPGSPTRFDYAALDTVDGRLYINHMGADQVVVYDIRKRQVVATLDDFPSATGITLAKARGLAFVSTPGHFLNRAAGSGSVQVLRLSDLVKVATLEAGGFPDGSAWVPELGELFVSNERGASVTVIGGDPLHVLTTLPLGGEAGNSVYDAANQRVLVNVQTRRELVAINPTTLKITQHIALPPSCDNNHGLLVDDADRLVFVACDHSATLLTLSLPDLQVIHTRSVGDRPDVLAFDAQRHHLYVASESGVVDVFGIEAGQLKSLCHGSVGLGAHVVVIDSATGLSYFPLANVEGHPVLRVMRLADTDAK